MDEDDISDEVVGSIVFDLKDIIDREKNGDEPEVLWKNIYGSPMDQSGSKAKTEMNEHPEIASNWKGRVLMQVCCEETEKPIVKVQKIDSEVVAEFRKYADKRKFDIIAEIGQAVALPKQKEYTVKMIIGGKVFETEKPKAKVFTNYNRFNERFE
jgi:hypothetical protein